MRSMKRREALQYLAAIMCSVGVSSAQAADAYKSGGPYVPTPQIVVDQMLRMANVQASDYVITMGCGDACPYFPGKTYLDWQLDDPAGQGVEAVRPIRDDIKQRVLALIDDLGARGAE